METLSCILSPLQSSPIPSTGIQAGRVTVVITDDKTDQEIFDNYGQWSSIGCIFFEKLDEPTPIRGPQTNKFARPLFPNNSTIPLKNEIVYVISLPDANVQSSVNSTSYYYFQPVNIWGSTHHNAIEDNYNLTKKALAKAIEEGDTDAQIKFNEELVDLKTALALQKIEKQQKRQNVSTNVDRANYVQQNPAPQLAQEWWKKNSWFNSKGYDQETALARAIDVQLDIEGFDKNSPDYYQELNNRLQKQFPALVSQDEVTTIQPRAKSRQTVAPTTGGSGLKSNRLKMSRDELAMARELGITEPEALKKYAKEIQTIKNRGSN